MDLGEGRVYPMVCVKSGPLTGCSQKWELCSTVKVNCAARKTNCVANFAAVSS